MKKKKKEMKEKVSVGWAQSLIQIILGLLGGSDGKEFSSNTGDQVRSLGQEDSLEKDSH